MNQQEKDLTNKFIEMQLELKPTISIEIGAHNADFSRLMSGKVKEIFAFEASPHVYDRFKNDMPEEIKYINKAVSEKTGTVQFQMQKRFDPAMAGNNTIKIRTEDTEYEYIDIEAVSLDEYFTVTDENICLWIDVEGANKEVLMGAKKVLEKTSSIHIEVEELEFWKDQWLHKDVSQYLASFGFKEIDSADVDIHGHQKNIIYLKS